MPDLPRRTPLKPVRQRQREWERLTELPRPGDMAMKPSWKESDYKVTRPEGEKFLQIRQSVMDEWLVSQEYKDAFRTLVAAHDHKFNPSGQSFRHKRPAEKPDNGSVDSRAISLPAIAESKADLSKTGTIVEVVGAEPFYELLAVGGKLYVHGLNDGVISDEYPLFGTGVGDFTLGADAASVRQDQGVPSIQRTRQIITD